MNRIRSKKRNGSLSFSSLAFTIFLVLSLILVTFLGIQTKISGKNELISGDENTTRNTFLFTDTFEGPEDLIIQEFRPQIQGLDAIKIRFAVNEFKGDISDWKLGIGIYDAEGECVQKTEVPVEDVENWGFYEYAVTEKLQPGETYQLRINQEAGMDGEWTDSVVCFLVKKKLNENIGCVANGEARKRNIELVYHYSYFSWKSLMKIIVGVVFVLLLWICARFISRRFSEKKGRLSGIFNVFLWAITPVCMYVFLELMTGNLGTVQGGYIGRNLLICYCIYLVFSLLTRKLWVSSVLYCVLIAVLGLVEYYVMLFRGRPFMLFDILSAGTAMNVMDSYTFEMPVRICTYLYGFLAFLIVQFYFQKGQFPQRKRITAVRAAGLLGAGILIVDLCHGNGIFGASLGNLEMWKIENNYKEKGFLYTLLLETQYIYVEKPEDYSTEAVRQIVEGSGQEETGEEEMQTQREPAGQDEEVVSPVNLIIVMNESLTDYEVLGNMDSAEEVLPYIHSLEKNTEKGILYSPSYGGGTADAEYEVLTGNTKEFLGAGTMAYEVYAQNPEYGIALTMAQSGYRTVAMHPLLASNYNRQNVYPNMGFDSFLSIENWRCEIENIRGFASDRSFYKRLIQLYEEKEAEENLFVFGVTLQNHGSFSGKINEGYEPEVSFGFEDVYPMAETYLTLAHESDAAFETLIDCFSQVEEPTMIVMFGDHHPAVENEFYEMLAQSGEEPAAAATDPLMRYMVPYIIWTNYSQDINEGQKMSMNYFGSYLMEKAGMELTPYSRFLLQLKETLPIIRSGMVCDKEGDWYALDALPEEYQDLVEQYKILQYNNLFDRKNLVQSVFSLDG